MLVESVMSKDSHKDAVEAINASDQLETALRSISDLDVHAVNLVDDDGTAIGHLDPDTTITAIVKQGITAHDRRRGVLAMGLPCIFH